ncbi:MAG: competence type IV pilus major pilin ComGC [Candidatus Binatia bacterium]
MKKIVAGLSDSRGFTLLELAIVLAGLAIVTTAAVPYFIREAEVTAAHRTSKEVASIQEAAKWYYISNNGWPASVGALQTAGYLNPSWPATNPWGSAYSISSNSTSLTVTTTLPDAVGGALSRGLPGVSYTTSGSNRTTSSVIPVPGQEASLTQVTNTANDALTKANESALPAGYNSTPYFRFDAGDGFNDCENFMGRSGAVMVGFRRVNGVVIEIFCRDTHRAFLQ